MHFLTDWIRRNMSITKMKRRGTQFTKQRVLTKGGTLKDRGRERKRKGEGERGREPGSENSKTK